jgi:hypothetical protein
VVSHSIEGGALLLLFSMLSIKGILLTKGLEIWSIVPYLSTCVTLLTDYSVPIIAFILTIASANS